MLRITFDYYYTSDLILFIGLQVLFSTRNPILNFLGRVLSIVPGNYQMHNKTKLNIKGKDIFSKLIFYRSLII